MVGGQVQVHPRAAGVKRRPPGRGQPRRHRPRRVAAGPFIELAQRHCAAILACSISRPGACITRLPEQERQIRARCALGEDGKAWELTRLFTENGVSASVPFAERLAGAELTAALQPGDHIIAAKLDRMFRSAEDAHSTVNRFKAMDVHLRLLDFSGDCSGNGVATLLLGVLSSVAQWERERIAERISEGKAQQIPGRRAAIRVRGETGQRRETCADPPRASRHCDDEGDAGSRSYPARDRRCVTRPRSRNFQRRRSARARS